MISTAVDLQNFTADLSYATTAAATLGEMFEMRSPVEKSPGDPLANWLPKGTNHIEGRGKRKSKPAELPF